MTERTVTLYPVGGRGYLTPREAHAAQTAWWPRPRLDPQIFQIPQGLWHGDVVQGACGSFERGVLQVAYVDLKRNVPIGRVNVPGKLSCEECLALTVDLPVDLLVPAGEPVALAWNPIGCDDRRLYGPFANVWMALASIAPLNGAGGDFGPASEDGCWGFLTVEEHKRCREATQRYDELPYLRLGYWRGSRSRRPAMETSACSHLCQGSLQSQDSRPSCIR